MYHAFKKELDVLEGNRHSHTIMPWKNKEDELAYQAKWREANREKCNAASLKHYYKHIADNPERYAKHLALHKKWRTENPEKYNATQRTHRKKNPEKHAVYQIRKNYKVSLIEAGKLLERKRNGCELCGSKNRPHIDHCHTSGRIRGILCSGCNLAIGHANEDPNLLRKLAAYVKKHAA